MTAENIDNDGPFGPAMQVGILSASKISAMYKERCGVDIEHCFRGNENIFLFLCNTTGLHYWRPKEIAGDEGFYHQLSDAWENYYQDWRWEYGLLDNYLTDKCDMIEVGCGRGFFLKYSERKVRFAKGLELNRKAIDSKVTRWDIDASTLSDVAGDEAGRYNLVCSFQVLEHVGDPRAFIEDSLALLKKGGRLVLSVPNYDNVVFRRREDPFDLPPHHINHFTPDTFRSISSMYDMIIEKVVIQKRAFNLEPVAKKTRVSLAYRFARRVAELVFQAIYARMDEPGHTMLVVLRKR